MSGITAYSDELREEWWGHLAAEKRPWSLTEARMRRLKALMWNDRTFWWDVIGRHGGQSLSVVELHQQNPRLFDHCLGNFHSMLIQKLMDLGVRC